MSVIEISFAETNSPGCNVFAVGTNERKITRYLMKAFMEIVTLIYTAVEIRKEAVRWTSCFMEQALNSTQLIVLLYLLKLSVNNVKNYVLINRSKAIRQTAVCFNERWKTTL